MPVRIVLAVEKIPYRLESQKQTLFKALAQRGCNNRFNGPFGACQEKGKKSCRDCHLSSKGVQTNPHRRQEKGAWNSKARLQSNEVHSGA